MEHKIFDEYISKYAESEFTQLFFEAGWKLKIAVQRKLAEMGLDTTPQQAYVLYALWEKDCVSQTELSHLTCKQKSNLTRIIDNLEKKGYVQRVINENDRRSFNVKLTQKGQDLKNKVLPVIFEVMNQAFGGFTKEEDKIFNDFLNRVINNLDIESC